MESLTAIESHLINDVNCVLVPPANPEKLAEVILSLKNNPEKRKQIASQGYQTYMKNLSMDVVGKRLVKIIEETLSR